MSTYLSNFGDALAKAEARKSPLLAALYQTSTGKSPYEPDAAHGGRQPAQQHGRYKGGGGPDPALINRSQVPLDMDPTKQADPLNPDAGSANIGILPVPAPSVNVSLSTSRSSGGGGGGGETGNPSLGGYSGGFPFNWEIGNPGWGGEGAPSGGGETWGPPTFTQNNNGGGDGGPGGSRYNPYPDDGEDMAHGGMVGSPTTARVAESGPEVAGGQIVSKPSIVKLEKGESVIPLTPRSNNKLQPDLLEGHVSAMKSPGMQFSRYKSYGQGKGLMR